MWIFTPDSFLSVVAHRTKPGVLLVRARLKGDIERVFPLAKVRRSPSADYLYRAEVDRDDFADAIRDEVLSIDYPNVKGAVAGDASESPRRIAMSSTWEALMKAQRTQEPNSGFYTKGR